MDEYLLGVMITTPAVVDAGLGPVVPEPTMGSWITTVGLESVRSSVPPHHDMCAVTSSTIGQAHQSL